MDALKHAAKDHSSNIVEDKRESTIKNKSESEKHVEFDEEEEQIGYDKYKCIKCKKKVLKTEALRNYTEEGQKWCSLCTILNYGDN